MDKRNDQLPELGTRAAAVAGIESLIHTALRAPGPLEPLQLRYWLDAYYQARLNADADPAAEKLGRFFATESVARKAMQGMKEVMGAHGEEVVGAELSAPP